MAKASTNNTAAAISRGAALQRARNDHKIEQVRAEYLEALSGKVPELIRRKMRRLTTSGGSARVSSQYYESASTSGRLKRVKKLPPRAPWAALDKSARDSLRGQTQQTERNNVVARGLINRYVDMVIGDGPTFTPTSKDDTYNTEAARLILAWMEGTLPDVVGRPNIRGMTAYVDDLRETVRAARLVDGDQLKVRTYDEQGFGCLQYIEADRLMNKGQAWADTESMCGGVEMNAVGKPVAYHVAGWTREGTSLKAGTFEVRAEHASFLPNPVGFKANQVRGEPQLQAALDLLDILNEYIENTALASEVATWIGAIFKSDKPQDLLDSLADSTPDQPPRDSNSAYQEVGFGPGFTHVCKPGEGVEQVKPEFPTTNFKDFVHAVVQLIGADVGLPLVLALFVTSEMSWSNLRGVLSIAGRGFSYTQDWARREIAADIRWKLREFIDRGLLKPVDGWDSFTILLPPAPVLDFEKEVAGYVKAIENNLMDEETAVQLLGTGAYRLIVERRGKNRKLAEAAGVVPPTMPGAGVAPSAAPKRAAEPEKASPAP